MIKKIAIILIITFLIQTCVTLTNNGITATASSDGNNYLDTQYIYDITYNLSRIINIIEYKDNINKGRYFGSEGEHYAAENIIGPAMTNLNLVDPTDNQNLPAYLELITNIPSENGADKVIKEAVGNSTLTVLHEITARGLTLNYSGNKTTIDCYITRINTANENNSINEKDLKIIKAENYLCTDDYFKNVYVQILFNKYYLTTEYISSLNNQEKNLYFTFIGDPKIKELTDKMELEFQEYYDFTFPINSSNSSTYPSFLDTIENVNDGFVFFQELPAFHPTLEIPPSLQTSDDFKILYQWSYEVRRKYNQLLMRAWNETYGDKLKGVLYYDYDNDSFNTGSKSKYFPKIYINGTIGRQINLSVEDYKIDFYINQSLNTSVISYNVIGQINASNPNTDEYVIIGCLYDSQWCQGTVDSAIGVGMMLAIAKYLKEHPEIKLKYNIRFVAYGAEEVNAAGAWHYEATHLDDKIKYVIDLNQLGYNQTDVPSTLNIATNEKPFSIFLDNICDITDYPGRIDDGTDLDIIYTPYGSKSDDSIFAVARWIRPIPPYNIKLTRSGLTTVMFLKDNGWYRHHRDGNNHTEGDSMKYYSPTDVALTSELVWNVTKYICIYPDCWFEDYSYDFHDSPNDNDSYYDSVNISYSLNTSIPHDRIKIKAELKSDDHPILCRYKKSPIYTITPKTGIQDNLTIKLPCWAPQGNYTLRLHLFNSTGEINNNFWNKIYDFYIFNYLDANETKVHGPFFMSPPNKAPDNDSNISCPHGNTALAGTQYSYTTSTNDTENNQIYYQFEFGNNTKGYEYTEWMGPYNSSENCTIQYTWTTIGNMTVRARARDQYYAPRYWTNWTQPLNQTINKGCTILNASTNILINTSLELQSKTYNFTAVNWSWNWDDGQGPINFTETTTHIYNETGTYTINLTVKDNSNNSYSYEKNVQILSLISDFNITDTTIKPNIIINLTDTSLGEYTINNWTWNLGDGNISYSQNISHTYSENGTYNVTLTVKDNQNNNHTSYQIVKVDSTKPSVIDVFYTPNPITDEINEPHTLYFGPAGILNNVTIYADFFDDLSGVEKAILNITSPNGTYYNITMNTNINISQDYEYIFSDIDQIGRYNITVGVFDNSNNSNYSIGHSYTVNHMFGNMLPGSKYKNISDNLTGSIFTVNANGTADNITAYIKTNLTINPSTKCMIYRHDDSELIGTTETLTPNTGTSPEWIRFNFSNPKPILVENTQYVLSCWSNDTNNLYYDETALPYGRYNSSTYGSSPDPVNWTGNETRLYSVYCSYTTTPEITNIQDNPDIIGFGFNTTINADVKNFGCGSNVYVNITYPDNTSGNYSMSYKCNNTYEYIFDYAWLTGQYNYTIWTIDRLGTSNSSNGHSFNVSAQATMSICTIKDSYGLNETVNLTDPPGSPPTIGYELLDDDQVLHMWNEYNSYYFNISNGIQLTNHKDEYWTQNVLMLGYHNNDVWDLIYRTDELSGFTKNVTSDNETFVNATLWKDLTYQSYDFRLAIRYYLGVDDVDLTVKPYIKNIDDEDIPYVLGFGWEMKNIRIANVTNNNYLRIYNGTGFEDILLNQTLDNSYTNMGNHSVIRLICTDPPTFHLSRDLYLSWNKNLTYKVTVKSRTGQDNAPVTLFIRVGNLSIGQVKTTMMHWLDSDDWLGVGSSEYDSHCGDSNGHTLEEALDGTDDYWSHHMNHDHYFVIDLGQSYNIKKFRGRSMRGSDPTDVDIYVSDNKSNWGTAVITGISTWQDTGSWQEVSLPKNSSVSGRYVKVEVQGTEHFLDFIEWGGSMGPPYFTIFDVYRDNAPDISNPYPVNGSNEISISPTLNITVSDPDGDNMNITWYSNSSVKWEIFGTNTSVSNGTYHQVFSNASVNGQWWYWKVNVTDISNNTVTSPIYKFYTGNQSKIKNTGSTNIKGYLLIKVEYYNSSISNWTLADDTINEITMRTINTSDQLGLDTIFNNKVNTTDLLNSFGNGTYRVYAAFRDPDGDVLVCDDESLLEATYEFTITNN